MYKHHTVIQVLTDVPYATDTRVLYNIEFLSKEPLVKHAELCNRSECDVSHLTQAVLPFFKAN